MRESREAGAGMVFSFFFLLSILVLENPLVLVLVSVSIDWTIESFRFSLIFRFSFRIAFVDILLFQHLPPSMGNIQVSGFVLLFCVPEVLIYARKIFSSFIFEVCCFKSYGPSILMLS
ncbi:uncharacterized protein G2W53_040171 [Senna tora]|uniref:Uncharacterized protein n=1 Tax=Senna tora TaxID=362788 RepID=A0A834W3H1_9FABA|nr:uncharacterized protein G2W53_040171 [Senna tora]